MLPLLFCLLSVQAVSAGRFDPFGTAALAPPPVASVAGSEGDSFQPCARPDDRPLSLSDVIDAALCANPQTREAWANARAQAAQVGVAQSAYLPSLNGSISADRNWTDDTQRTGVPGNSPYDQRDYGISLSWLLFDFGGRAAALESARQLLDAATATQDASLQSLFLDAVQGFFQVQAAQAALDAARLSEAASFASFNAAEARYKTGVATPADKLQAQTAWSQAQLNRIKAEGDLRTAQGVLANVIGRDANRPVVLASGEQAAPPERFEQGVDSLVEQARSRRPDLRAAEAQARAALANVDSARASGRPSIALGISHREQRVAGFGDSDGSTIGVTLNIPLFSGFNTTYRVRAAQAQAQSRQAQSEALRLRVALDVWQAYQALTTATQTVRSSADLLSSAEQSERVASGRYRAGAGTILDVLSAQSALASARQQRVLALYNWNIARASLAQAMGTLDRGMIDNLRRQP